MHFCIFFEIFKIRKKSGKVGKKRENPYKIKAKPCPLLILKMGKNPLFLGRNFFFMHFCILAQKYLGKNPLF